MVVLLVVCTILLFLGIDLLVQAVERRRSANPSLAHLSGAKATTRKTLSPAFARGLWQRQVPAGIFVDPGHGSAQLEASGRLRVGVDQLVLAAIGVIDRIETLAIGTQVKRGQPLLRLYRGGELLEVTAPASGTIHGWNAPVLQNPALAFERLYAPDGWMLEIEPDRLDEEIGLWKIARETAQWMSGEMERLRSLAAEGFFSKTPAAVLADGGNPIEGFLSEAGSEAWDRFNREFLGSGPYSEELNLLAAAPTRDAQGSTSHAMTEGATTSPRSTRR